MEMCGAAAAGVQQQIFQLSVTTRGSTQQEMLLSPDSFSPGSPCYNLRAAISEHTQLMTAAHRQDALAILLADISKACPHRCTPNLDNKGSLVPVG